MKTSVVVLGAGIVGASVALHLAMRGVEVSLVDRAMPGSGATFGNAGLVQREAVLPAAFPRAARELARIARNRSIDVSYHPGALPRLAPALLRYWWHSAPDRYAAIVRGYAALIRTCVSEHEALAREAGVEDLLRPIGYLRVFDEGRNLDEMAAAARALERSHDIGHRLLDGAELAREEPLLLRPLAGAIHWTSPRSLSDPQQLTLGYVERLRALGGRLATGDAASLARKGAGWAVRTAEGHVDGEHAVVALGAASALVTGRFGYRPPTFAKRGYHSHYRLAAPGALQRPTLLHEKRVMLAPMRGAIRLTTGIEFAAADAPPTPVQIARAEPIARALLPLGEAIEDRPWHGLRPACADMLPVIGPIPGQAGLWAAFGHGHQGLTLGPTTGRLLSERLLGETPFVDPAPYEPARFV